MKFRKMHIAWGLMVFSISLSFSACDKGEPEAFDDSSTWKSIESRIIVPKCANCHYAGSSFARQSGLVLTPDSAYQEIVSSFILNRAAKADGLEMLGKQGIASLGKSYFWEKINAPDEGHFYDDHPYYGAQMPLGDEPLTNGELKLIKSWILAGAPKDGLPVTNAKEVLADSTRYTPPDFSPLTPPASGVQLKISPFAMKPGQEREFNQLTQPISTEDLYINRMEMEMRKGSHHFLLYTFRGNTPSSIYPQAGIIRDLYNEGGGLNFSVINQMNYHVFFGGTQWARLDYRFPPGVALKLPRNTALDMNVHNINRSDAERLGEVQVNLHTIPQNQVQKVAQILDLNNTDINLPPNQVTTIEKTFIFNQKRTIFQLFSHAHRLNTAFKVQIVGGARNGEIVYVAYDWEHPPILNFETPLVLEAGEGLRLIATYHNTTNETVRFGLSANNEMMILFGYYY